MRLFVSCGWPQNAEVAFASARANVVYQDWDTTAKPLAQQSINHLTVPVEAPMLDNTMTMVSYEHYYTLTTYPANSAMDVVSN